MKPDIKDRAEAEALASALKLRGVTVFFDTYEQATLWGKNLYTYLSDLYQNKAHYCVTFLSKHYAAKLWTNHEREAAQARAFQENDEYILPIRLDGKGDLHQTFGPEDIFTYMYAIFHAPAYRERYAEFLKIDFPRLPLTSNTELFRELCKLGNRLVKLHLMEGEGEDLASYPQKGNNVVDVVKYTEPGQGWDRGVCGLIKSSILRVLRLPCGSFMLAGIKSVRSG